MLYTHCLSVNVTTVSITIVVATFHFKSEKISKFGLFHIPGRIKSQLMNYVWYKSYIWRATDSNLLSTFVSGIYVFG